MAKVQRYETRPLECWPKVDEIRHAHFRSNWEAQKRGDLLIMGTIQPFQSLFTGFGDYANCSYSPYTTGLMRHPDKALEAFNAYEAKGFGRYMCSSYRLQLGHMYQGLNMKSPKGENFKPDFIFDFAWCPDSARAAQLVSEYLDVPHFILDVPYKDSPHCLAYLVSQMQEALEWMEKVTGRKVNDEKLIEGVRNEWRASVYWAKTCELSKAIPAPLDMRHMGHLRLPASTSITKKECVEFYAELYDEVKFRVENHISARGLETARLLLDPQWPFVYSGSIYREPEKFGAVIVGGRLTFSTFGAWEVLDDGSRRIVPAPEDRGLRLETREDALNAIADLFVKSYPTHRYYDIGPYPKEYLRLVKDYSVDGVIFHYDRGCRGYLTMGLPETMLALQENGVPAISFDGSMCDMRDFTESSVITRIDTLMDMLGLEKVTA